MLCCRCYRVGEDENGFSYTGNSVVLNHMGEEITSTSEKTESTKTASLSKIELEAWREKFPISKDGDEFEIS